MTLSTVQTAAARARKADQVSERAHAEFRNAVAEARAAGATLSEIAKAADLTRGRIHQLVTQVGR